MGTWGRWILVGVNVSVLAALAWLVIQTKQRSDTIADRLAIADVIAQYAYRWDTKDASGFADLFTRDVVVERWTVELPCMTMRNSRMRGA